MGYGVGTDFSSSGRVHCVLVSLRTIRHLSLSNNPFGSNFSAYTSLSHNGFLRCDLGMEETMAGSTAFSSRKIFSTSVRRQLLARSVPIRLSACRRVRWMT